MVEIRPVISIEDDHGVENLQRYVWQITDVLPGVSTAGS